MEEKFPFEDFLDAGYNSAVYGQKSYNGVAILSKYKIEKFDKKPYAIKDYKANMRQGESHSKSQINNTTINISA